MTRDQVPTEVKRMVYGVTIQTLDRSDGNGITMIFVDAPDAESARVAAKTIGARRYDCVVLADHAVPCPGFTPSATGEVAD